MKTHLVLGLLIVLAGIVLGGGKILAQSLSQTRILSLVKPTTTEDVGLIFLKLAAAKPDFGVLIRQTRAYKETKPAERSRILAEETSRLSGKFGALDAKASTIVIRTAMEMNLVIDPAAANYALSLKFPESDVTYFPYDFLGRQIAVVADGIENFKTIALTKEEAAKSLRHEGRRTVTMVLELKPVSANNKAPMTFDGVRYHLMLTKIGYIGFFTQNMEEVWSWKAPWHEVSSRGSLLKPHPSQGAGGGERILVPPKKQ